MEFSQAREVLNHWSRLLDGKDASSNKSVKSHPLSEGEDLSWWMSNDGSTPDWRNGRTVAYLCAYLELSRAAIPMTGVVLDDGYMHPDRAVIRTLVAGGLLALREGSFVLSDSGEILVAPFMFVDGDILVVAKHFRRN